MSIEERHRPHSTWLEKHFALYHAETFIARDVISIPYSLKESKDFADLEISALLAAIIAFGRRDISIAKLNELLFRMDGQPGAFVRQASEAELSSLVNFRHRTFGGEQLTALLRFLRTHYAQHQSLESAFAPLPNEPTIEGALTRFSFAFHGSLPKELRWTYFGSPARNSACKRLCMFLRWMVRTGPVDFGVWKTISPSQLIMPLDVHSGRVGRELGLLTRKQDCWKAAIELTDALKIYDPEDPVKYDFALFGFGEERVRSPKT